MASATNGNGREKTSVGAEKTSVGAALVVGAGIAGMQAALDLAEAGIKVYLLDRAPAIGGTMAQLDKTFPTNDCAMCIMSPKLVEVGRHLNIERRGGGDPERAGRFYRNGPAAPALRGPHEVHRLRRLRGCLPDCLAGRVQRRSFRAQSHL
jgi:NADPH-dependent 2,4-dienoyl-CoA reductase/sulfur reductase-like enzyme